MSAVNRTRNTGLIAGHARVFVALAFLFVCTSALGQCLTVPAPSGVVTSVYGWRFHPVFKYWRPHRGVDLRASLDTPLVAAESGVVQVASSHSGGNEIRIIGSNGVVTRYLHLTRSLVRPGTTVSAGQPIALSGDSGDASAAPHLHFEVYDSDGHVENPEPLLCPTPSRKPGADMSDGFPVSACNPKGGQCTSGGNAVASDPGTGVTPPAGGYQGSEPPPPGPDISQFDDMSTNEILSSEVVKRFGNPDWYRQEAERGTVPLLAEQAQMWALRAYIRYLNHESFDRIEALLAANLARANRQDIQVRLARQRKAAAKADQP